MTITAIKRAITIAGSQQKLAALSNLTQPAIHFLACGKNGKPCYPRYQTAKKLSMAVGGAIAWHEFMEQVATQLESPEHGTECPTRSSDAASSSALESGIITQGCPSQPIEY